MVSDSHATGSSEGNCGRPVGTAAAFPISVCGDNRDRERPLYGYPVSVSSNIPSTYTEGSGTGLTRLYGYIPSWAFWAQWGTPDLMYNPYILSTSNVVVFQIVDFFDMALADLKAFAMMENVDAS